MKLASALVCGHQAGPELAEAAVHQALARAGAERADFVLLLLSRDFNRHPQAAVLAAARAAGSMQVAGCTAHGLLTEQGWQLDQPAAAAMVFADWPAAQANNLPLLSLAGGSTLPYDWRSGAERAGLLGSELVCWSGSRLSPNQQVSFTLPASRCRQALSTGLRPLGKAQRVSSAEGFELHGLGRGKALDNLLRALPPALRARPPLHQIAALRQADAPAIAILSTNADGSLTMADRLLPGESVTWAIRQPLSAEQNMRDSLNAAVDAEKPPDFALMFSCIGRGPLFYGDDDRDLLAFRQRFPGVPLLGAYGSGQIAAVGGGNRLFQNSVVTLLFESSHV